MGTVSAEFAAAPGGRRAGRRRGLLRRGRRRTSTTSPGRASRSDLAIVAREGARPAVRREPAPGSGVLPRDDASLRLARRRRSSCRATSRPSTTCSTSTPRTAIATDFTAPTCCIVKQTNPTGLASADRLVDAYQKALEGDPVSAFGAVVALNREVDGRPRGQLVGNAYEAVVAPALLGAARRRCSAEKQQLALLAVPADSRSKG